MRMDSLDQQISSQEVYVDPEIKFFNLIREFVIQPFGKYLN